MRGLAVGRSLAMDYLQQCGLRVQQKRVGKALVRVDSENSWFRWAVLIKRWKYSFAGLNSLWHADGHHSFIHGVS